MLVGEYRLKLKELAPGTLASHSDSMVTSTATGQHVTQIAKLGDNLLIVFANCDLFYRPAIDRSGITPAACNLDLASESP